MIATALCYMIPVGIGYAMSPDLDAWNNGYFVTLAGNVAPWLAVVTTVASAFSAANNFLPQLGTTSRALRYTALLRMLPLPGLTWVYGKSRTPIGAILLQGAVILVLLTFSFDVLVVANVMFYDLHMALQFCAFLRLRYVQPDAARPFLVPGGLVGAWALVLTFFAVLGVAVVSAVISAWWSLVLVLGANVLFLGGGMVWVVYGAGADKSLLETVDRDEARVHWEAEEKEKYSS